VRSAGLAGRIEQADKRTGEVREAYSTEHEPGGVLLKACGNRRASVCPACAETYRRDAWHLIAAGLRGGKGIPETVSEHPRLFLTSRRPASDRCTPAAPSTATPLPASPPRRIVQVVDVAHDGYSTDRPGWRPVLIRKSTVSRQAAAPGEAQRSRVQAERWASVVRRRVPR